MPATTEPEFRRPLTVGHAVFATTLIALGVLALIHADFTPPWAGVPEAVPVRGLLTYVTATISVLAGLGLLWPRRASLVSGVLLSLLLLWLVGFRATRILVAPAATDTWWGCGDAAVMVAAAWVLYVRLTPARRSPLLRFPTGQRGLRIAHGLYGLALVPFGIAHFTYLQRTVAMVPAWLPGHLAWACLTGVGFLAAAGAILSGVLAPVAAALAALEIGAFTLLVWGPVLAAGPDASQWTELLTSWALTAAAWVVAESYRTTWEPPADSDSASSHRH